MTVDPSTVASSEVGANGTGDSVTVGGAGAGDGAGVEGAGDPPPDVDGGRLTVHVSAVTARVAGVVTVHVNDGPVQAPLQPLNVDPLAGATVKVTVVPGMNAWQLEPQSLASGVTEPCTLPEPLPARVTVTKRRRSSTIESRCGRNAVSPKTMSPVGSTLVVISTALPVTIRTSFSNVVNPWYAFAIVTVPVNTAVVRTV
jgi:hypothetical protein